MACTAMATMFARVRWPPVRSASVSQDGVISAIVRGIAREDIIATSEMASRTTCLLDHRSRPPETVSGAALRLVVEDQVHISKFRALDMVAHIAHRNDRGIYDRMQLHAPVISTWTRGLGESREKRLHRLLCNLDLRRASPGRLFALSAPHSGQSIFACYPNLSAP
jgi:hypothetical protein